MFFVLLLGYGVAVHPCTIMLKRALYSIGKEEEQGHIYQGPGFYGQGLSEICVFRGFINGDVDLFSLNTAFYQMMA